MRPSSRAYVARPLNVVFGTPSHIAVLRELGRTTSGATGREISQAVGVAHQATLDSLARLEAAGLVRRQQAGRAYLFRLNRRHHLVRRALLPLLSAEAEFGSRLRRLLRRACQGHVVAAAIFGSVARGEDVPESDLDVCLVTGTSEQKQRAMARIESCADTAAEEFGLRLSPIAFSRPEFKRKYARRDRLVRSIVSDAQGLIGPQLKELATG